VVRSASEDRRTSDVDHQSAVASQLLELIERLEVSGRSPGLSHALAFCFPTTIDKGST